MAPGVASIGIATGVIPYDPAKVHAPAWILIIAGAMFIACGLVPLARAFRLPVAVNHFVAAIVLVGLTTIVNWVAFGPGERRFTGSAAVGGFTSRTAVESMGRVWFGAMAILLDVVIVLGLWDKLRSRRNR